MAQKHGPFDGENRRRVQLARAANKPKPAKPKRPPKKGRQ